MLCLVVSLMMVMTMIPSLPTGMAFAAAGDTPDAEKNITDNGDGTYTLSVDIVGESEVDTENTKANIVVILDRSGSMRYYVESDTGRYGSNNDNPPSQNNVYGNNRVTLYLANGTEVTNETTPDPVYTRAWQGGRWVYTEYTGKRYADELRMAVAKDAINDLVTEMQKYNAQVPNTVQMALVSFSDTASTNVQMTGTLSNITTAINRTGQGAINPNGGTNWEQALQTARSIANNADDDPTYVIFVTDGNPTLYGTGQGTGQETTDNINTSYNAARDDARGIVNDGFTLYNLGVFGSVDRMESLTTYANGATSADKGTATYYSVANKAELQEAFAEIIDQISENIGITDVDIVDGTTQTVTTEAGVAHHLLEVVPNSFKYYRSGGDYGNMKEWTSSDDPAPPEAHFNEETGQVEWDLSPIGVLENNVKYTVTFDVYPSQETYDLIAQLKNGDIQYSDIDPAVSQYIDESTYALRTNTTASYSWTDTREENPEEHSKEYTNPPPVATSSDSLPIKKEWEGGTPEASSVDITVLADEGTENEEAFHTATLTADNGWETSTFISVGIIKNGEPLPGAMGHDFSFAELDGSQYHWEIDAPVVRPMLIDGGGADHTPTMLIKVDEKHKAPSGATTYTIDGNTYYVDSSAVGLTATNHRRSNLNLTKVVTGEDAPEDAKFPFQLTVNNLLKPESEPSAQDDPKHESDWWVWLSVRDENGQGVTGLNMGSGVVEDSGGYYYAPSGTTWNIEIGAGWSLRFLNLPSGSTYTFAEGTLPEGFAFNKAELIEGEDSKFSGGQTTTGTIENTKTSYKVEYTNDYALTDLEITKVWDDASNQDGIRLTPDELAAKLTLSPSVEGKTPAITDNGNNTYTIKYTGLPRFNNGQEVTYTVAESAIDGYTTTGSPAQDHGTITNTHEPETTELSVTKVWDDKDNQDNIRPTSVSIQLKADGTATGDPVTLNAGNSWTYKWTNLPKNKSGRAIEYTVEEAPVDQYTTNYSFDEETLTYTVTNSYTPQETSYTVTKSWDDNDNQDGVRPTAVNIQLYADGTAYGDPVALNANNTWTYTWTTLPKLKAGVEIAYSAKEIDASGAAVEDNGALDDNYTATYTTAATSTTVTNTHNVEKTTYTVTKVWNDNNNQDGIRPASISVQLLADGTAQGDAVTLNAEGNWTYTWENLDKFKAGSAIDYSVAEISAITGYTTEGPAESEDGLSATITNTHETEETSYTFTKVWSDANNQDGVRPDYIQAQLYADGEAFGEPVTLPAEDGSWSYTWSGLDANKAGVAIVYTAKELDAEGTAVEDEGDFDDNYKASYETTATGTTVTNSHDVEKTYHTVTKTWADADNQDGIRPDSIQVQLKADGTAVGDPVTLPAEDGSWSYTWQNLDANKNGVAIVYTADETAVPAGYEKSVDDTTSTATVITNTHTPSEIDIKVKKTWVDNDNQDGIRPTSVSVHLSANGTVIEEKDVTLSADNSWSYTWTGLPQYSAGTEITYAVTEDAVAEYETEIGRMTGDAEDGFEVEITNTHEVYKTTVTVTKVWEDKDDQDGIRPDSINVQLMADGTASGDPVELSDENEWTYTWEDLDVNKAGKAITYNVEEPEEIEGYETEVGKVTGSAEDGFEVEITNTHEVYKTTVTVTKVWEDENDQDGIRPGSIKVQLMADGTPSGDPVELSNENEWTYTWEDLDVNKAGKAITYEVDEPEEIEGYETEIGEVTGSAEDGFEVEITNTHEVYKTSLVVSKVWDDADDKDGVRPDSVTVRLLANGKDTGKSAELSEANKWAYAWVNLDVNKEGKAIEYTVTEDEVENYEAKIGKVTGNADDGFKVKITNYHKAKPDAVMIDPPVQKVVKGNPSKDETFTFQMKAITKGAPMPEGAKDGVMSMDITGSGEKEFGEAWFTEPGQYVYEITEVDTKAANYKYDSTVYTLTVDIVEEADGTQYKLVKTETVKGGEGKIVFTNTYEEPPVPTGDTTIVAPYIIIGISALILLLMLLFRTRKNRA